MLVLPLIVCTYPPCGVDILQQIFNPLLLFLFTDMEEKFHHQIPVIRQLPFKPPDAVQAHFILLFFQLSAQPQARHFLHPSRIQEYKLARLRNLCKVTA